VISLDLHGILTDRMLRQIDGVAIYHTIPMSTLHRRATARRASCTASSPKAATGDCAW
jgi:microcystin degradation protein MlrC